MMYLSDEEKKDITNQAKALGNLLEVDLTISIFGQKILSWHFPSKCSK